MGARWTTDADVEISRQAYGAIARVCGRPVAETSLMYSMLGVGQGATVALRDPEGRPLYRFCVGCFQDDTVPHLRIEWRLMPWKVCPQHLCRLQSRCVGCHKPWKMETAVLRDRRSKARTLAHCRWCGLDQRQTVREQPSPKLAYAADFGRAVVSALANRHRVELGRLCGDAGQGHARKDRLAHLSCAARDHARLRNAGDEVSKGCAGGLELRGPGSIFRVPGVEDRCMNRMRALC